MVAELWLFSQAPFSEGSQCRQHQQQQLKQWCSLPFLHSEAMT
jgi:hypothetical protein